MKTQQITSEPLPACDGSARSRKYRGNFYITVQEADGEERRISKLLYPGWKKLETAKRVAEEMLHAWDINIGHASWAVPHILRIYDASTLIEAHYWQRQNARAMAQGAPDSPEK